jgi:glucose-1-phosphate cytidylyltransferase
MYPNPIGVAAMHHRGVRQDRNSPGGVRFLGWRPPAATISGISANRPVPCLAFHPWQDLSSAPMKEFSVKVAILAGGQGTRMAEETETRPKPMVEIGGLPLLMHIMLHYSQAGFRNFIIALGHKGDVIRRYMAEADGRSTPYLSRTSPENPACERYEVADWTVELVETGANTKTGGRIKRLQPYLGSGSFMLTWGDGVSNVDLSRLYDFHREHGKLATVTAVRPPARFGELTLDGDRVSVFEEKAPIRSSWINGAFFVLEPEALDFIDNDNQMWEDEPLERLAGAGQLMAYRHQGFWQCMDTPKERDFLEELWRSGTPPWKTWR